MKNSKKYFIESEGKVLPFIIYASSKNKAYDKFYLAVDKGIIPRPNIYFIRSKTDYFAHHRELPEGMDDFTEIK